MRPKTSRPDCTVMHMWLVSMFFVALAILSLLFIPAAQAAGKGSDGWIFGKSQQRHEEYKFNQEHGRPATGRQEIRNHQKYYHGHHGQQSEMTVYWTPFGRVTVYRHGQ